MGVPEEWDPRFWILKQTFPRPNLPPSPKPDRVRNGTGEGTISQAGGSGGLTTVFLLPLELGQPDL